MRLLILLCCLVLELALAANSTYFITVPRIIFKNSVSTATISVSSLPSDATITISLKQNDKNYGTFSEVITSSAANQIIQMKFSMINDPAVGLIQFKIKAEGGLNFLHRTGLDVKKAKDRIFIQTDKPIYKPGGKIKFRVVGVDKDLKPLSSTKLIDEIYVLNPSGSRMVQWTNVTLDVGMENYLLELSTKPVLGTWKIIARSGSLKEEKSVKIEKYVLPKFEVQIIPPAYVLKTDKIATIKICGRYTYGKKVSGVLEAKICLKPSRRYWYRREKDTCISYNQKVNKCTDVVFPNLKSLKARYRYGQYELIVNANITEDGTGVKQSAASQKIKIHASKYKMKFEAPETFKPGFLFKVKLLITTPDGRPATDDVPVTLKVGQSSHGNNPSKTKTFVKNGVHVMTIIPEEGVEIISFNAEEVKNSVRAYGSSKAWYSPSKRYIKITNTESLNVGDTAKISVQFSGNSLGEKTMNYILVCKGKAVAASSVKVSQISTHLTFKVVEEMVPRCRLLVYYFYNGEFISDNHVINFELSFKNKVSLGFDDVSKRPGEEVALTMSASPGSKIAVSAVDQSIKLLGETNDIEEEDIISVLEEQDVQPARDQHFYSSKCRRYGRRYYRSIMPWMPSDNRVDGKLALKETGVKYFTNADVDVIPCRDYTFPPWWGGSPRPVDDRIELSLFGESGHNIKMFNRKSSTASGGAAGRPRPNTTKKKEKTIKKKAKKPELRIRKDFPETWLWFDEYISSSGKKKLTIKVPDTVTTWHANAFAMSPIDGIGVSNPTTLKAFQPFFISLHLPYSVKRGEIVKIPATVFNYLDKCLVIGMSLDVSNDFTALTASSRKVCVCGGEAKTVKFGIKATKLGKIDLTVHARSYGASTKDCGSGTLPATSVIAADALTKKLLVEAEGIKKEYSKSVFFCPSDNDGGIFTDKLSLNLPKQLVPGSVYTEMNVVGDLLGPSMSGLDKLLAMPYGCGEQNMLKFAPNVYIMDYLKASGQSDPTIKSKAIKYMTSGYQRELTYRHKNGGYSAFGKSDKEASTWLTAFVLRTYAQARRYIFIDPKEIEKSKNWLLSLQNPKTGCFKELGMVHHKEMKGGVKGGITMTSFVLIALLEADVSHDDIRIKKAVECMAASMDDVTDSYTTAVLAFAFKMAGSQNAETMLKKLDEQAVRTDNLIHWEKPVTKKRNDDYLYYHAASSVDIEMTGYSLMAYIGGAKPYGSRLDHLKIVKWMVKQRNSDGGFTSTQDTCVGLQALSQYSAITFSGDVDLTIKTTESLPPNSQSTIKVTQQNKLVLQKFKLETPLPYDLDIEASGKGCALLQANVKYNEQKPGVEESFYLNHKIKQDKMSMTCRHSMKVCGSFTGSGKSNMALIDVAMVSGFEPIIDELDMQLQMNENVPFTQYEFIDGVLTFYFNEFEQVSKCVEFGIEQVSEVEGRKPAAIKIYDYYDKDSEATKMYNVGKCPETNIVS